MRIINHTCLFAVALFCIQPVFADYQDSATDNRPCGVVAKSCLDAGYTRDNANDKRFWIDCMRPLLLGQTVQGVNVDAATAKKCRTDKIDEMKKELKEFQQRQ